MLEPWNNSLLEPPPINTFFSRDNINLEEMTAVLHDIQRVLSNQSPLHQEGAILQRLIYKLDKKFRNDIGYKNLKKVNTAIKRYIKVNLAKDVDNFAAVVPTPESNEEYLPTRQMLQYVMVRIQSFCKIMLRIVTCAKKSAIFYWNRVTSGESHWMSLMPYAVLARIWSLCSILLNHSCKWYKKLYPFLNKLQEVGVPFLPKDYELAENIDIWLDLDSIEEHGRFNWSENKSIKVISSMISEEDEDENIDLFKYVNNLRNDNNYIAPEQSEPELEPESAVMENTTKITILVPECTNYEEINVGNNSGVAVSRESFHETFTIEGERCSNFSLQEGTIYQPAKKIKLENELAVQDHSKHIVSSEKQLKVFLAKEERLRNGGNKQALSKHLSFMQWQSVKNSVTNLYGKGFSDEKIVKKFKKIWKSKCEDYLLP